MVNVEKSYRNLMYLTYFFMWWAGLFMAHNWINMFLGNGTFGIQLFCFIVQFGCFQLFVRQFLRVIKTMKERGYRLRA